ncbi:hypothetical protein BC831DRAFT_4206 [Entophlyctis helioformis]|nr:hypothetical protein BC831DRAFT_4206 [Entophlyctis helioformis]
MVSFVCEVCQETIKKPKLDQHFNRCPYAQFSCVDCSTTFHGDEYRTHTSCISEAEKYEKTVYKGPKTGNQASQAKNNGQNKNGKQQPVQTKTAAAQNIAKPPVTESLIAQIKKTVAPVAAAAAAAVEEKEESADVEFKPKKDKKEKKDKKDKKEKKTAVEEVVEAKPEKKDKKDKKRKADEAVAVETAVEAPADEITASPTKKTKKADKAPKADSWDDKLKAKAKAYVAKNTDVEIKELKKWTIKKVLKDSDVEGDAAKALKKQLGAQFDKFVSLDGSRVVIAP